jgi:hypothetical protein
MRVAVNDAVTSKRRDEAAGALHSVTDTIARKAQSKDHRNLERRMQTSAFGVSAAFDVCPTRFLSAHLVFMNLDTFTSLWYENGT